MRQHVGAIDQGTTSTRFIVFDRAGLPVAEARREHRQICPAPGLVEHDAEEIWANTQTVMREALAAAGLGTADLAAIGITNQRETTLLWDRATGRPLHHALVWQDTRTAPLVAAMAQGGAGGQDRFRAATGLPLATYFSALKLVWLLDHIADARARAQSGELAFGTMDSWLLWKLTGRHATDVTNAGRTQLMNLAGRHWDPALLDAFGVPAALLGTILPSSGDFGAARDWGGVPVAGVLGDQHAALLGQGCIAPGEAKNTYGTGCFLLMHTGDRPVASGHGLLTTMGYQIGETPCYALEGSIAVAGALVQWLRDRLGLIESSAAIETLAASVPDNGDVYIVPAFAGLFAPYWRADARGVIVGLSGHSGAGHIARAALEASAHQVADVVDAMAADGAAPIAALRVDGGMAANSLLMQFQADLLGVPVTRPRVIETTALGAAIAAGIGVGLWDGPAAVAAAQEMGACFTPAMAPERRAALRARWKQAVARSLDWVAG
ncbi:MAG: glycerol kinase GlpK [Rhodospirillales bacterium]|nr:glycerol kinase GlpK [Rhodospirillales bacterium]